LPACFLFYHNFGSLARAQLEPGEPALDPFGNGFQDRRGVGSRRHERSDRKTYNLSWVGKSAGLPAIEAIEGFLAPGALDAGDTLRVVAAENKSFHHYAAWGDACEKDRRQEQTRHRDAARRSVP